MKFNIFIVFFFFNSAFTAKSSTIQLPMSQQLLKSFPKIRSPNFIIINKQAEVVLHHQNSEIVIRNKSFGDNELTLYDICCLSQFSQLFFKYNKLHGCMFVYNNLNLCEFTCVLYGASSEEGLKSDIDILKSWLDQFFTHRVSRNGEYIAEIPVFYGRLNKLNLNLSEEHFLLFSCKCRNEVTKVFRYRTALQAPVEINSF
ncbi:MAG: hypothetical protein LBF70_02140, partial [Holosporales bacterium]|nr:hypothetical protein [Holosporales bacterium]